MVRHRPIQMSCSGLLIDLFHIPTTTQPLGDNRPDHGSHYRIVSFMRLFYTMHSPTVCDLFRKMEGQNFLHSIQVYTHVH